MPLTPPAHVVANSYPGKGGEVHGHQDPAGRRTGSGL